MVHIGLCPFISKDLEESLAWECGPVERIERIEPIRFLVHGTRIDCISVEPGSIGVEHPEDVQKVAVAMARLIQGQ